MRRAAVAGGGADGRPLTPPGIRSGRARGRVAREGTAEYDVFISYSQRRDRDVAAVFQRCMENFGRPWYRPVRLRVFRDITHLGASPDLRADIENALARSNWLVVMASPHRRRVPMGARRDRLVGGAQGRRAHADRVVRRAPRVEPGDAGLRLVPDGRLAPRAAGAGPDRHARGSTLGGPEMAAHADRRARLRPLQRSPAVGGRRGVRRTDPGAAEGRTHRPPRPAEETTKPVDRSDGDGPLHAAGHGDGARPGGRPSARSGSPTSTGGHFTPVGCRGRFHPVPASRCGASAPCAGIPPVADGGGRRCPARRREYSPCAAHGRQLACRRVQPAGADTGRRLARWPDVVRRDDGQRHVRLRGPRERHEDSRLQRGRRCAGRG